MSSAIPQPVLEMSIESVSAGLQFADTSLMEYAGNMVAMLFYRADFDDETCEWIESLGKEADTFEMLGCKIILCSTDSKYTHFAWRTMAKKFIGYESLSGKKVPYAMIGDKNQRLSRALGVLDEKGGYSKTALLIIDKEGRVRHREVKQNGQLFSAAEIQSLVVDLRAKVWLAYGQVLGFS